jgi:hypothetical protein
MGRLRGEHLKVAPDAPVSVVVKDHPDENLSVFRANISPR